MRVAKKITEGPIGVGTSFRAEIIDRGKVVADGTPQSLKKLVPGANSLDEVFRSITREAA